MSSSFDLEDELEESQLDDESLLGADISWIVQKKCGTCFLCHIVCLLPFLPSRSILEAKIEEDRVYNVVAFCAGTNIHKVPTRSKITFFQVLSSFRLMHQSVVPLGGVYVCFPKSVTKGHFSNVWVGGDR